MFIFGMIIGIIIMSTMFVPRVVCLQDDLYKEIRHNLKLEERIEELTNENN